MKSFNIPQIKIFPKLKRTGDIQLCIAGITLDQY